ncbi:hypothetical protein [Xanthomonas phage f20-Xaj]|uniref:Uncharacterized protein n=2 Tax=Pradovirus TaxID=1985733 RepID=A0A127AVZ6_9CAUD|nr:hypothetical protein FDI07_gp42 [Xanthomonas phage f20-Xaj]YP_009276318.1 hypothetical protein FDI08_gp17 [Xanthomonas phage f30-Xaj]AMM44652.1 hypothetical protein [Xanthomonas phage f20-Xaj]AMM44693.1 hypothetical protein [Xanthomonas phage f30-Xaj]
MLYKHQTAMLIKSYENAVAWGGRVDREEALQEAVKAAFPSLPEDAQAELYTQIEEQWESYRESLAPRKLWIGQIVNSFFSDRVSKAQAGFKVSK